MLSNVFIIFNKKYLLQCWNSTIPIIHCEHLHVSNDHRSILWNMHLIKCSLISSYWGPYLSEFWGHCTQKGHQSIDGTLFCLGSYRGQCWDPIHPFHRMFKVRFREFSWIMCYLWIQGMMESPMQNVYKQVPCFSRIRVLWIRGLLKTRLQPQPSLTDSQLIGESWGEEQAAWKYLNCGSLYVETEEIKEEKKKNIFIFLLIEKLFLEVIT